MGSYLFGSSIVQDISPYLPEEFESKNGKVSKEELLKNELIGVYFSAHWCGPCRAFTPKLAQFYNNVNSEKKQMEIVFNSCDGDLNGINEYFGTMPWIATPFESEAKTKIEEACGISSIPQLIIFNNKGQVIDDDGRRRVESEGDGAIKTWKDKNVPKEQ